MPKSRTEQSFELGDLCINTRMPNLLEIDIIHMTHGSNSPELRIEFTEMKSDKGELSKDRVKLTGLASRYILRPYCFHLVESPERPSHDVFLRGCLPEVELFLNQLIACADPDELKRLATEVFKSLEGIGKKARDNLSPLLSAALFTMCDKARWLSQKKGVKIPKTKIPLEGTAYYRSLGLYPPKPASYSTIFVAVGFMDSLQMESTVKAITYSLKKKLIQVSGKIILVHSNESRDNATEMAQTLGKHLGKQFDVSTLLQSDLVAGSQTVNPTALIITEYRRDLTRELLSVFAATKGPSADVYAVGVYSTPSEKKALRIVTLLKYLGTAGEFVAG